MAKYSSIRFAKLKLKGENRNQQKQETCEESDTKSKLDALDTESHGGWHQWLAEREQFELVFQNDSLALLGANNNFLSYDEDDYCYIVANRMKGKIV